MTAEDQSKKAPARDSLYDVPVEEIEVSYEIHDILRENAITSIGDCVDNYELLLSLQTTSMMASIRFSCVDALEEARPQVRAMLKEKGYFFHFV
jgi:hypothetical protein